MSTAVKTAPTPVPYYVRALAMALPAVMLGLQISGWIFFIASIRDGHPDFRANYTAGLMVKTGRLHELYDYDAVKAVQDQLISREVVGMPFIHPAYEALAYVPFALLPFHAAYGAFLIANLLLLFFTYQLLLPELTILRAAWTPLPVVLCITFLPVGAALMQGQDSILLLTLFACAWALMTRGNDLLGGLVLGLGLFRFQFVIPIFLLFLLWRKWRIAEGIAFSGAASLLVSVAMVGTAGVRAYVRLLASMSVGGVSRLELVRYAQPVTAMGSLRALIFGAISPWLSPLWVQMVTVVLSLAILLWVARAVRAESTSSDRLLIAVTTSAVVGYHMFIHDMAILLLPIGVWLGRSILAAEDRDSLLPRVLLAATVIFTAPILIVLPEIHFYWVTFAVVGFLAAQMHVQRQIPRKP